MLFRLEFNDALSVPALTTGVEVLDVEVVDGEVVVELVLGVEAVVFNTVVDLALLLRKS